jgi:hypothetical protein
VSYAQPQQYVACSPVGAECGPELASACCGESFCTTELAAYGPGHCAMPQPDSSFCLEDAHCESGRCYNYTCADPSCREHGDECYDDPESCCPGLFCFQDPGAYGLALCAPPQPTGTFCLEDRACISGRCVDNGCL